MDPQLIDRVYESAFTPDLWPNVLDELAGIAGARTGFLFLSRREIHQFTSSTRLGIEAMTPPVESGWIARSERFLRLTRMNHPGFLTEASLYKPEEMETDPFYRDLLY